MKNHQTTAHMAFLVGFIVLTMAIVAGAKPVSTGSQTDIAGQSAPVALDVSSDVSNNNTSSADLVLGNLSGCSQNTCPDYGTGFDLLLQQTPTSTGGTYDTWYGRVGDCSLCQRFPTGPNGCFDFSSCGRNQVICVDIYNNRAHRIWKDNGAKGCYYTSYSAFDCGGGNVMKVWTPGPATGCTWPT